tara:strand:+ start:408 stop:1487 length:1080 start_codon:yes stop_codon:yes gene_type:complete
MYSLGDYLYLYNDYSYSFGNYSYYYSTYIDSSSGYTSATEYTGYYGFTGSYYYDSSTYSSQNGTYVDSIYSYGGDSRYDRLGRIRSTNSYSLSESNDPYYNGYYWYSSDYSTTYNYLPYSYRLKNSLSKSDYTDIYGNISSSTSRTEYSYSNPYDGTWDYDQSRTITEFDDNGDGITDSTTYELSTYDDGYNSYKDSYTSVTYENGQQTGSYISDYRGLYTNWGSIYKSEYEDSDDWNGDGITDYKYESSYNSFYNNFNYLSRVDSSSVSKSDYNYDGYADYISSSETYNNGYSTRQVDKYWSNNYYGPDTMNTITSIDYNNDGIYDYVQDSGYFIRYLSLAERSMGGHVATFQDTLIS